MANSQLAMKLALVASGCLLGRGLAATCGMTTHGCGRKPMGLMPGWKHASCLAGA